jgi:uncharacterized protein YcbK (DUF882 family)
MTTRMTAATAALMLAALSAVPAYARPQHIAARSTGEYAWPGDWPASSARDDDDDDGERATRRTRRHSARDHSRVRHAAVEHRGTREHREARDEHAHRRFSGGPATSRGCLRPAARALLARIETTFGPVQIVSTCRPGAVIAGSGRPSKHASGEAIDFNAPRGRKAEVVRWLIANHRHGGTMTYAHMGHIHVDVGYHFVALNSHNGG